MEVLNTDSPINELERAFLNFARGALSLMEEWIANEELPSFSYLAYYFGEGSYKRRVEYTDEYGMLLQKHGQDLLAMEEALQCVQRHIQAGILFPSLKGNKEAEPTENIPPDAALPQQAEQLVILDLIVPVIESCKHHGRLSSLLDERLLLTQYRRLIAFWSNPFEQVDITFPLVNFSSDASQPQQVSEHLFLVPFTPADKTALWNDDAMVFTHSAPPLSAHTLMSLSWKLSGTYAFRKNDTLNSNEAKQEVLQELGDIVTALRLLKKGDVGAPAIYEKNQTPVLWQGVRKVNILGNQQVRQFPLSPFQYYELSEHEIPDLKDLSKALHQLRTGQTQASLYGDMAVALRRFNQSYNRELPEDQIIDLTIALESSLLAELRDELNYRLSLRGTALLASGGKWEPSKSQALLKAMYDIRSNIVHNGRLLSNLKKDIRKLQRFGIETRDFVQWCEDIVRDVLKEYVLREARGQSLKQVNEELDKHIVENLGVQVHPR